MLNKNFTVRNLKECLATVAALTLLTSVAQLVSMVVYMG